MTIGIKNQFRAASADATVWEKTEDGFLRTKARILKECVMAYLASELTDNEDDTDVINMYVSGDAISEADALRTLGGCPIVIREHNWLTPDTIEEFGKGSVAGAPRIDGPYLEVDLLVTHPDAIEAIESREIGEISAGYHSNCIEEEGVFGDKPYTLKQVNLKFNHIAIIPYGTGRAGVDVKILNKDKAAQTNDKSGGNPMAEKVMVQVRLRNTKRIINTDEEGAALIAEEESKTAGLEEQNAASAKSLEECMAQLEAKTGELDAVTQEVEELKGELSVYKEQLDRLLSTDAIEEAAVAMNAEQGEAEEILENMAATTTKEEEKEQIVNARFQNGKPLYGEALHRSVMNACGIDTANMSASAVAGAFKAQNQIAKRGGVKAKVVNGHKVVNSMQTERTTLTPHQRLGFK